VVFRSGTALLGAATLNGSGVATFSTTSLPAGSHLITATYLGSTDDSKSTSGVVKVTIT